MAEYGKDKVILTTGRKQMRGGVTACAGEKFAMEILQREESSHGAAWIVQACRNEWGTRLATPAAGSWRTGHPLGARGENTDNSYHC